MIMVDCKNLCQRLESDDPDTLRDAAFEAGESCCLETVPFLARLLCSNNLGVQEAADRALRKIGGKQVVAAVKPLLRSDDAPARNAAMKPDEADKAGRLVKRLVDEEIGRASCRERV